MLCRVLQIDTYVQCVCIAAMDPLDLLDLRLEDCEISPLDDASALLDPPPLNSLLCAPAAGK